MKKVLIAITLVFLVGCQSEQKKRVALEQRFKEAYPDNWKQKLLEYDIATDFRKLDNAEAQRQEIGQRLQNMSNNINNSVNAYDSGNPGIYFPENNGNNSSNDDYWQEQRAQQEYWEDYRENTRR
jgi:hypothetical protein